MLNDPEKEVEIELKRFIRNAESEARTGNRLDMTKTSSNKKVKKKQKNMEVMITTYFFVGLFLVMIGYLCNFVIKNEEEIFNNSYNSRQEILLSQNYRGSIFASGGETLATTIIGENGEEIRHYPYNEMFSHVVGFSTHGRTGIEAQANYYLINSNSIVSDKVVNDMTGVKNPGDSVYTTLDVTMQEVAYKALGVYDGAVIVSEPSTGKILAMVSKPDFDPNVVDAMWDELTQDNESGRLINRATQGLYPPGSTFKIVTALEYIRQNKDNYDNYRYQCNGHFGLGGYSVECYHGANHGSINFEMSLANSCNSSFANIGASLDKDDFRKTLDGLLFDNEMPLKFNYSQSSIQMDDSMTSEDIIQTAIGQGKTQMTPIHLNMITCAIANGGELMQPYAVDYVTNDRGGIIRKYKPTSLGQFISENEADILKRMMNAVVDKGNAKTLSKLDYTVAGKTGSAEYNSKGDSHAWFTGFAPVEDPQVCITLIVEGAGSGGDYAVPLAKRLFEAYFKQSNYSLTQTTEE